MSCCAILLLGLLLVASGTASAVPRNWTAVNGWWNVGTNWAPPAVPGTGDDARMVQSDGLIRLVTYANAPGPIPTLASYQIDATGGGRIDLDQNVGTLNANTGYVGDSGLGWYYLNAGANNTEELWVGHWATGDGHCQMLDGTLTTNKTFVGGYGTGDFLHGAGTHTANGVLVVGGGPSAVGTYTLQSAATLVTGDSLIADYGTGTFTQTGGTHTVNRWMFVGRYNTGTYDLQAGSLQPNALYIGYHDVGTFTQSGGTVQTNGDFNVGDYASGVGTYTMTAGSTTAGASGNLNVGREGTGTFDQSGGTVTVATDLYVGRVSGSSGTYNLSGSGSLNTANTRVGYNGTGTFHQTSGSTTISYHTISQQLYVGDQAGGTGTYTLDNGVLTSGIQNIGFDGDGTFIHNGGMNHVQSTMLRVGVNSGSTGRYELNGGGLRVDTTEYVGHDGDGTFIQTGGTHNVLGTVQLGANVGSTGSFELSGGSLSAHFVVVGVRATGTFTHSGGSASTLYDLTVGGSLGGIGGDGTYNLGGTGVLDVGSDLFVGSDGTGVFNQTGGTNTVGHYLSLGTSAGSGTYNLSGGTLDVGGKSYIGWTAGSTARFKQTGGTYSAAGHFHVGYQSSDARYELSAGTLNLADTLFIGSVGGSDGVLVQSGGDLDVGGDLLVAEQPGSSGTLQVSGGTLDVDGLSFIVGEGGTGVVEQDGGTVTCPNDIILGEDLGSHGTYRLGGTGALTCGRLVLGSFGTGVFEQTGGACTVDGDMIVGLSGGSHGTCDMDGGSLSVAGTVTVGATSCTGTVVQSGGAISIGEDLRIRINGSYYLSGTGSLTVSGGDYVGHMGNAEFHHSGGTHHALGDLWVGYQAAGTYDLGSGFLTVDGNETVGDAASGSVAQVSGTHTVHGELRLGDDGGIGQYDLSGKGNLDTTATLLGYFGYGYVTQSDGDHATGLLVVSYGDDSYGTYTLSGGTLDAHSVVVGRLNIGEFTQTGGTHTVATTLTVREADAVNGMYHMQGGSLDAATIQNNDTVTQSGGTIDVTTFENAGTYDQTGGTLNADVFNNTNFPTATVGGSAVFKADIVNNHSYFMQTGGTVRGRTALMGTFNNYSQFTMSGGVFEDRLENSGSFSYSGGAFNGIYVHWPAATFDWVGDFTAEGGIINYASLESSPGRQLFGNGLGIHNYGTLQINGGRMGGTTVTNDFGAQMSGYGTIDADLVNNGTLDTAGMLIVTGSTVNLGQITVGVTEHFRSNGALTSTGVVELQGGAISGGPVTNGPGGVLRGYGGVSAVVTNDGGVIHATGSQLTLTSLAGGNVNGGELRIDDGSRLHVVTAFASSGTVVLQGENAELLGGAIDNTGTIRGTGRVSNPVHNSGVVRAESGTLTLSGAGATNAAGGRVEVQAGATVVYSQGLTTNAGTIALTGGTFDNNARVLVNTGQILGRGTLYTGGLTNDGLLSVADGDTDLFGDVTNNDTVQVTECKTTFFGSVTNAAGATIKNTDGTIRFLGTFTNNGTYTSDPADNYFGDMTIGATGCLIGGAGDRFLVSGDLRNACTANAAWDTDAAELVFRGGGAHRFELAGTDLGAGWRGLVDNFAWGVLRLDSGDALLLADGNAVPGAAVYVTSLILEDGLAQLGSITGNGFSIYYDPTAPDNAYLGGNTYGLLGGGEVVPMEGRPPIPEPAFVGPLGLALAALVRRRRR